MTQVEKNSDPMSDGQVAYELAFPQGERVPFVLIPSWMQNQWHRKAKHDKRNSTRTPSPASPSPVAEGPWRCFHCDEVFTDTASAVEHFGPSLHSDPACKIDAAEYRRMEEAVRRANAEDTDKDRDIYAIQSQHRIDLRREEEKGYAIGLADGRSEALSSQAPKPASAGGELQDRVAPWMQECFGPVISADRLERSDRFIEESLELVQACGYDKSRAHALVEYVYGRPVGHAPQEVGGVMVTLAALCLAHGFNMHEEGAREVDRVSDPAIIEKIRAKQASKPTGSALPIAAEADTANKVDRIRLHGDAPQSCAYGKCDGSCIELGPCNR